MIVTKTYFFWSKNLKLELILSITFTSIVFIVSPGKRSYAQTSSYNAQPF